MKILFVCTGNTCRSPMAEALGMQRGEHTCSSAGIYAQPGSRASLLATQICHEHNLSLKEHRARLLNRELLDQAQLVLTMTSQHKDWILEHFGKHPGLYTLGEYAGVDDIKEVSDPFGGTISDYHVTLIQLNTLLDAVWRRLQ
ncbi:low molecular weight protein arginine phosphatase [Clostridia bacterium]|nr:low molecular weight protein arginine phosphatase [Clostridia bacterium]